VETNINQPEFVGFPKIARLSREIIITEKIDGTSAQVLIGADGSMSFGSRTRWLSIGNDNFGFAAWCESHRDELSKLGVGRHYGEWWGSGIQRGYGLKEKRFSLFNTARWHLAGAQPHVVSTPNPHEVIMSTELPACVHLVPVLYQGMFTTDAVDSALNDLRQLGSCAASGFMNPEGVVVFHTASRTMFKKTLEHDESPKGKVPNA